ncbi:MAG: Flp pilus assembly protein CpaB [Acidimicrobiia bacterium]|nr:Flp pilus assembly protein CpaB [Acidimicrobiia bacterium]
MFSRLSFGHAVMIIAGLLAFLLNVLVLREEVELVEVLVAAHNLSAGSRMESGDITYRSVDSDGAFTDRALTLGRETTLIGQVIVRDIPAGAPLMASDLRPVATPDEQRAMSIAISPDRAVGAALDIGDRVDVLLVENQASRFIVTGIEILAVGSRDQNRSGWGLTVEVSPVQAMLIAAALESGTVHLLRSTGLPPYRNYPAIRDHRLPLVASGS